MARENSADKPSNLMNLELLTKLVTAMLGVFFVLGLLVSNLQLMALGITDFSSIQIRSIMSGAVFVLYFAAICLAILPIALGALWLFNILIGIFRRSLLSSLLQFIGLAVALPFLLAQSSGILYYFLLGFYPSVPALVQCISFSELSFSYESFYRLECPRRNVSFMIGLVRDAYLNWGNVVSAAFLGIGLALLGRWGWARLTAWRRDEEADAPIDLALWPAIYLMVTSVFGLLYGYANEIYPNVRNNLGGGQPHIAELQIGDEKLVGSKLPGIQLCCDAAAGTVRRTVMTEPVAIWHQTDRFIFISNLSTVDRSHVQITALDSKTVLAIHYLPKYVKVTAGGRVKSVHSY